MDEFGIEVTYEGVQGEVKTAKSSVFLKKGETRMQAVLDVAKLGFQIETSDRGVYDFIPAHRLLRIRYVA